VRELKQLVGHNEHTRHRILICIQSNAISASVSRDCLQVLVGETTQVPVASRALHTAVDKRFYFIFRGRDIGKIQKGLQDLTACSNHMHVCGLLVRLC
jgi:hypothetical protein